MPIRTYVKAPPTRLPRVGSAELTVEDFSRDRLPVRENTGPPSWKELDTGEEKADSSAESALGLSNGLETRASSTLPRRRTTVSYLLILAGLAILSWALWPIVSFTLFTAPMLGGVVSPIQDGLADTKMTSPPAGRAGVLSPVVSAASDTEVVGNGPDYTNANVWFPTSPQKKIVSRVTAYTISIPKVDIKDALVTISGDDLNKSLVHYGGTGLPGEYGTTVIFGHSVLPQFYNPTNYKTIFSTLPTLKPGDEMFVRYDGVEYRYVVYEMIVTEANDLTPLAQRFDDSYVTLITCVPPGTYWKRLNVRARLEKI